MRTLQLPDQVQAPNRFSIIMRIECVSRKLLLGGGEGRINLRCAPHGGHVIGFGYGGAQPDRELKTQVRIARSLCERLAKRFNGGFRIWTIELHPGDRKSTRLN